MKPSQAIPAREMERMMKLQHVILKAIAKKLSWMEAAGIAGMSVRNMQRKRQLFRSAVTPDYLISGGAGAASTGCRWRSPKECWRCSKARTLI